MALGLIGLGFMIFFEGSTLGGPKLERTRLGGHVLQDVAVANSSTNLFLSLCTLLLVTECETPMRQNPLN